MRLTLAQKREIVERFWSGESVSDLTIAYLGYCKDEGIIEQVLRDYMNGKFKLASKFGVAPQGFYVDFKINGKAVKRASSLRYGVSSGTGMKELRNDRLSTQRALMTMARSCGRRLVRALVVAVPLESLSQPCSHRLFCPCARWFSSQA